jgi:hypothetical protein
VTAAEPGPAGPATMMCEAPAADIIGGRIRNFTCTLAAWHDWPEHIAHGTAGEACHRWPVTEAEAGLRQAGADELAARAVWGGALDGTGRDTPRTTGHVAHDVQFGPVTLSCPCQPGPLLSLREPHSLAFLTRIATEHETGRPA